MEKITWRLFFLFLLNSLFSVGQNPVKTETDINDIGFCGTNMFTESLPAGYDPARAAYYSEWLNRGTGIKYVPIKIRIGSDGPGLDAIDVIRVQETLDYANAYCRPSGIQFYMCGPPDIIVSPNLNHANGWQTVVDTTFIYGYINIYVTETLFAFVAACGTYNSYELINIWGNYSCYTGTTFAHELGHELGLYHTHESYYGYELANGSNCANAGDLLCDTPADPGLSNANVDTSCNYTGTALDSLGQPYSPNTHLIMSYSRKKCRDAFSLQQMNKMNYFLDTVRYQVKRYSNIFMLDSIPVYYCLGDGPVTLNGIPSGGTFSGPGVTGNQFYPSLAGTGVHMINYNYNGPADSSEVIDQYQYELYWGSDTVNNVWESFKSGMNGLMSRFDIMMLSDSAQAVNWFVYKGTGTGGQMVASGTQNISSSSQYGYVSFNVLSFGIPLMKDSIYTFSINTTLSPVVVRRGYPNQPPMIYPFYSWRYRDGNSSIPYRTIGFREWVWGVPVCDAVFRYVFVDSCLTTGVYNTFANEGILIHPNPAEIELTISNAELNIEAVEIYDALGNRVFHSAINNKQTTVNIGSFSEGIYFVKVYSGSKMTVSKVVKM